MKKIFALLLMLVMLSAMVMSVSADTYSITDNLKLRAAGGTGLSIGPDGKTMILSEGASNPHWSNGQMIVNDSLTDGFTVKIKDIVWDRTENNAVAITYSNHPTAAYSGAVTFGENSCFVVVVSKDGSVALWGNGFNSNHTFGKWAGVVVTGKNIGANPTEFTYSMVPNEDNTVYTFYVNNKLIYEYNVEANVTFHDKGIFATPERKCNFGFQVVSGDGGYQTGWESSNLVGTLAYTIEEVNSIGIAPEIIEDENTDNENSGNNNTDNTTKAPTTTFVKGPVAPDTTTGTADGEGDAAGGSNLVYIIIAAAAVAVAIAEAIVIVVLAKKKK